MVGKKERELVQSLNSALRKVGYEVVPINSAKSAGSSEAPRSAARAAAQAAWTGPAAEGGETEAEVKTAQNHEA